MMEDSRILLIVTGLGMGGAERQVCDLADQFVSMGKTVCLITMTDNIINSPRSKDIDVVSLNITKTLTGLVRGYLRARKSILSFNPNVVHSHMVHANIFSRLLRLSVKIPKLICTAHSSNEGGRFRMFAYRLTDSLCDFSTNVSQSAVDSLVDCGAASSDRIFSIHNGIDTTRFSFNASDRLNHRAVLNINDDDVLLLAVGRLTAAKDYPNLLTAFSILSKERQSLHLAIIGVGEEQEQLLAMVISLGLTGKVHFLGLRYDVSEWISAADLFVLSSAWEGFGLVVAEAMACKRIVVATDCGGVKEVVGDCGILVPPRDSQALVDGIERALCLSSAESDKIGEAARERIVKHYSLSSQANRWLELYK